MIPATHVIPLLLLTELVDLRMFWLRAATRALGRSALLVTELVDLRMFCRPSRGMMSDPVVRLVLCNSIVLLKH